MKKCLRCEKEKELIYFYKHKGMADGYLSFCRECTKTRVNKWRLDTLEERRAYDRKRGRTEKRLEAVRERQRNNREIIREYKEKWRKKNHHKIVAHGILRYALKTGKAKRGRCEVCNKKTVEAHHPDYDKPLDVMWLCIKHHKEIHRKYR